MAELTLNANQQHAVSWGDGPMLVLAGPGSGKTHVLASRIARLLNADPDAAILALTFTNKAAGEMRERVAQMAGEHAGRSKLTTFHGYATSLLRQHGSHIGLRPDFMLLTLDEDRLAVLDPLVVQLESSGHQLPTDRRQLLKVLDHLFRDAYSGGPDAPGLSTTPEWLPWLFERYGEALIEQGRQDYGSLLHSACRLLREKAGVARVVRLAWSHTCVDEFQDTNRAQYELLRLLAPERDSNLFVLGDEDQIVYQWNGASPEQLARLQRDYSMSVVQLPENYRCPTDIVTVANRLIANNSHRTPGKAPLVASKSPAARSQVIRLEELDSPEAEARFVANDIRQRGTGARDCVVLSRTTRLLEGVAAALEKAGLPTYLPKRRDEFETALVRAAIQACRLANARHDRAILTKLCVDWNTLSNASIEVDDVVASAALLGGDYLRAWTQVAQSAHNDQRVSKLLAGLKASLLDRLDFPAVLDWFIDDAAPLWADEIGPELADDLAILGTFHGDYLREVGARDATLHGYLQAMDLTAMVVPPKSGAVPCLTIHGSKGLEFDHVYLIGLSQEVLPSFWSLKKGPESKDVQEERRNCFVAITRARESLTLTRSRTYYGYPKGRSQFLREMAGKA